MTSGSTAAMFNEDEEYKPGQSTVQLIDISGGVRKCLFAFDIKCTDELFDTLLNSIHLYEVKDRRLFQKKTLLHI
jgi:hypothetical protein